MSAFGPAETEELLELTERMRELGVASFSYGSFYVAFRENVAPGSAVAAKDPDPPRTNDTVRDKAAKAFGALTFPGSK